MMILPKTDRNLGFATLWLLILLSSCTLSPSDPPTPLNTSPQVTTATLSPQGSKTEIGKITEIQQQPVWVKPLNTTQEQPAQPNMGLQRNETIRTEGQALAEIMLTNGLGFRIGGDAILTLQDNHRLSLQSGEMLTWVEPGKTLPAEIITSAGIAGIRGTTVFVKIPKDPNEETEFFAWEGEVAIRLPNQDEEILLTTGEELKIRRGEKNIKELRKKIRKFTPEEHRERSLKPGLMRNFSRPLPTLKKIETALPKKADRSSPKQAKKELPQRPKR